MAQSVMKLLFLVCGVTALAATSDPYLYSSAGLPVVEFTSTIDGRVQPDFLSSSAQRSFRLVEFYDAQDTKSIEMRDEFLRVARKLNQAAAKSPRKSITTYAVSCTQYPVTCQKQGISSYPTFRFYEPGSRQAEVLQSLDPAELIKRMDLKNEVHEGKWFSTKATATATAEPLQPVHTRTLRELQTDIHLSFDTAMRHYVYDHSLEAAAQPLSKFQRIVLKNWLLLVHKTIPPSWKIHAIVKELLNSFMYVAKNRIYLLSILDSYKLESNEYSHACQGPEHNAVTCGAWELLHAVSVGVVEYNKLGMARADRITVGNAAQVIGEYVELFGMGGDDMVKTFFQHQLQACLGDNNCLKDHSVDETDEKSLIESWMQLPLWISRTHTLTNHGIKEDKERRPHPLNIVPTDADANWPPIRLCPACWTSASGSLEWDEAVVYDYLKHEYTKVEEISAEVKNDLIGERIEVSTNHTETTRQRKSHSFPYVTVGYMGLAALCVRFFMSRQRKVKIETLPLLNTPVAGQSRSIFPSPPSFRALRTAALVTPTRSTTVSLSRSYHSPASRGIQRSKTFVSPSRRMSPMTNQKSLQSFSSSLMDTPSRKSISRRIVGRRKSLSTALPMYSSH